MKPPAAFYQTGENVYVFCKKNVLLTLQNQTPMPNFKLIFKIESTVKVQRKVRTY